MSPAVLRSHTFKYPEGVKLDDRVIANERHARAYKSCPVGRMGTVTAPCQSRDYCYVQWDGTETPRPVHKNHFNVVEIKRAGPFEADSCAMPVPAPRTEAQIYRHLRDTLVAAHCSDKRPAHKCAGTITITRDAITFQCPRCGDAKQTLTEDK